MAEPRWQDLFKDSISPYRYDGIYESFYIIPAYKSIDFMEEVEQDYLGSQDFIEAAEDYARDNGWTEPA